MSWLFALAALTSLAAGEVVSALALAIAGACWGVLVNDQYW